jgi:archaellum component FlaF (FlaF/FlaG flagellin family)
VSAYVDQDVTLNVSFRTNGSTTWRRYDGDTISAATPFVKEYILGGDDIQITIDTGAAPTVWEVSCRLSPERAT